jgi:hypothetical protein
VQAWSSDELQDDWEPERVADAVQSGSHTAHLRGTGGIVDSVVASTMGDMVQPLPPCNVNECCKLDDSTALVVRNQLFCSNRSP